MTLVSRAPGFPSPLGKMRAQTASMVSASASVKNRHRVKVVSLAADIRFLLVLCWYSADRGRLSEGLARVALLEDEFSEDPGQLVAHAAGEQDSQEDHGSLDDQLGLGLDAQEVH